MREVQHESSDRLHLDETKTNRRRPARGVEYGITREKREGPGGSVKYCLFPISASGARSHHASTHLERPDHHLLKEGGEDSPMDCCEDVGVVNDTHRQPSIYDRGTVLYYTRASLT